jgi:hypothetical protein
MSIIYGRELPKISLMHYPVEGGGGFDPTLDYALTLSVYHNLQSLRVAEAEEFDAAGIRLANTGRSLVNHRAGFRWMVDFIVDSHFLADDSTNARYFFESFMEALQWWRQQDTKNIIRVWPYADRSDIYFDGHIPESGFVKSPHQNETGIKTVAWQYQVSLVADALHITKPSRASTD